MLTQVTEARAKATSIHLDANDLTDPEKVKAMEQAQAQLSGALGRLLAIRLCQSNGRSFALGAARAEPSGD